MLDHNPLFIAHDPSLVRVDNREIKAWHQVLAHFVDLYGDECEYRSGMSDTAKVMNVMRRGPVSKNGDIWPQSMFVLRITADMSAKELSDLVDRMDSRPATIPEAHAYFGLHRKELAEQEGHLLIMGSLIVDAHIVCWLNLAHGPQGIGIELMPATSGQKGIRSALQSFKMTMEHLVRDADGDLERVKRGVFAWFDRNGNREKLAPPSVIIPAGTRMLLVCKEPVH